MTTQESIDLCRALGLNIENFHGQINIGGNVSQTLYVNQGDTNVPKSKPDTGEIPTSLAKPEVQAVLMKLQEAGYLDENFQPAEGTTQAQKGVIVEYVAARVDLEAKWKDFGTLWNIVPETLRRAYAKGENTDPTRDFYKKIETIH